MRVFMTGASGWIASGVIPQLLDAGHTVVGLARSGQSAAKVAAAGADVVRGSLDDLDGLRAGAEASDGVIHLGYNHDFSDMPGAARTDRAAIDAFGDVLAGSGRPLVIASGAVGLARDRAATEQDRPDPAAHPRVANAEATLALAERGVRSVVVRFAPTVHGEGDYGFTAVLAGIARDKRVAAYVGDGSNRWPAVHRLDAGELVRRVFEDAAPATVAHAVAESGVPAREIAEALGRSIGVPTTSVAPDAAAEHFGWIGAFFALDCPASNDWTRATFDWQPSHQGLIADIDAGYYPGTPNTN